MRTNDPIRWQALVDSVASISPNTIKIFHEQKFFVFLGSRCTLEDKDRYCTISGLNRQLDEFTSRAGIVYYLDEKTMCILKEAFTKTYEEQYVRN